MGKGRGAIPAFCVFEREAASKNQSGKYVDENRHGTYNKKCRGNPAGVCCRQAVSHSLTLPREGVMLMGNNRGAKALRFVVCLVIVLALAIAFAPKAC